MGQIKHCQWVFEVVEGAAGNVADLVVLQVKELEAGEAEEGVRLQELEAVGIQAHVSGGLWLVGWHFDEVEGWAVHHVLRAVGVEEAAAEARACGAAVAVREHTAVAFVFVAVVAVLAHVVVVGAGDDPPRRVLDLADVEVLLAQLWAEWGQVSWRVAAVALDVDEVTG